MLFFKSWLYESLIFDNCIAFTIILNLLHNKTQCQFHQIGLLTVCHSPACPKINLQYQNEAGMEQILKEVQRLLAASGEGGAQQKAEIAQKVAFQVNDGLLFQEVVLDLLSFTEIIRLHLNSQFSLTIKHAILISWNNIKREERSY